MTAALKLTSGSAAAPSLSFNSDATTGFYLNAVGKLGIASDGALAILVSDDQSVEFIAGVTIDGNAIITGTSTQTGVVTQSATSHMNLAGGTTAQRSGSPAAKMLRSNTTLGYPEYYTGASWLGLSPIPPVPQGRLTLTSGVPVIASDVTAATSVFYMPYTGAYIPIYDGTSLIPTVFTQLTLTLNSNHVASTIYDCFVINDAGTVRLVTGPAWNTSTAAAGARGTGAGTTQLSYIAGILTNTVSMTARNGATTYTVAIGCGTYVGSLFMDGTNGQISCLPAWGQSRKWGVWNAYNKVPILLQAGDSTASWVYNNTTARQSNGAAGNALTVFTGLAEEEIETTFVQNTYTNIADNLTVSQDWFNGIGWNSTTTFSARARGSTLSQGINSRVGFSGVSKLIKLPFLGINVANCMEQSYSSTSTTTYYGAQTDMVLTARYNG